MARHGASDKEDNKQTRRVARAVTTAGCNDKSGCLPGARDRPAAGFDRELTLCSYRDLCREIDRLLTEGCLPEAMRLNEQARMLFRHFQGALGAGTDRTGEIDGLLVGSCP